MKYALTSRNLIGRGQISKTRWLAKPWNLLLNSGPLSARPMKELIYKWDRVDRARCARETTWISGWLHYPVSHISLSQSLPGGCPFIPWSWQSHLTALENQSSKLVFDWFCSQWIPLCCFYLLWYAAMAVSVTIYYDTLKWLLGL
jgi:hypothetical protein